MNLFRFGMIGIVLVAALGWGPAEDYNVDWFTIDAGGEQFSTGAYYVVSGTIGQADAQPPPPLTGDDYEVVGGFWVISVEICNLLADVNEDGQIDGRDVQAFVDCILGASALDCACADIDENGSITNADQSLFIAALTMP